MFEGVRPEYADAINAVRSGLTMWLVFVPSLLIWIAIFMRRHTALIVMASFVLTCGACWIHARNIQEAKRTHAVTQIEMKDRDFDIPYRMAPISGIIYTVILCGSNLVVASTLHFFIRRFFGRRATKQPDANAT